MQIGVAQEFVGNVVTQQIGYYKVILPNTQPNVYGEALVKDYIGPVLLNCLIVRGDLEDMSRQKQLERKQSENQALSDTLVNIPIPIFIG